LDRRFQQFIVATIILRIIIEAFVWFYMTDDLQVAELLKFNGYGAMVQGITPLYYLLIAVRLIILIGLLSFHPTARLMFLAYVVATMPASILLGFRVIPPIEQPFLYLESVLDGVILALAYYSSVSERFREAKSQHKDLKT
jgi:hypothetical protein